MHLGGFLRAVGRCRRYLAVFVVAVLLMHVSSAFAVDFGDYAPIATGFQNFLLKINQLTSLALTAPGYAGAVEVLWTFFAMLLLVWTFSGFALRGFDLFQLMTMLMLMMMTRVLMSSYDTLTTAIWQGGTGIGTDIQKAMIGTSDLFFGPAFISQLVSSLTMPDFSWTSIVGIVNAVAVAIVLGLLSLVLGALSFIVAIWGVWGYALAKIIGYLFIPFLLYERLAFLFDGWLRFFFGFVLYALIARINIVLVVSAFAIYLQVPPSASSMPAQFVPSVSSLVELLGLFTFALVGIVALFSTGRFASAIVAGAGGGGVGLGLHSMSRSIARGAMGLGFGK